ncbi:MAG TPA: glutamate-5-semialdehyde dehydrogenase [Spirochaetota bacterium]|nr:glutamate-5-semialdehyde dehydrogenase [Spirochaetota bacterium]HPS85983.1 glutamate-5-semialdehyde dehydrogenase [Spirochaetota bacterium]
MIKLFKDLKMKNIENENKAYIDEICSGVKAASKNISTMTTLQKNLILKKIAAKLREKKALIIQENDKDLLEAKKNGLSSAFYDRLLLDEKRIEAMAVSVDEIAMLEDPIGKIDNMKIRPSGIRVGQMRVPLGVVAVIYESRPNVTIDIASLCIKSGNSAILRGGEESINSNICLSNIIRGVLSDLHHDPNIISFMYKLNRALVPLLLKRDDAIDIVIPRGGEGLIKMVVQESSIPVIRHEKGLCHLYIDETADKDMAERIAVNGKVQRPGVCNAIETLLIHECYPYKESLLNILLANNVEIRGCDKLMEINPRDIVKATSEDWATEYLDLIISAKIVSSFEEAVEHISTYSSGHTEAIITSDYFKAERFMKEVDSSAIFLNASTRFHDGGEFGLGAEVGISTQKLHARGVMGIEGLTTLKYVVYGNGEIR